ncbi:MAG: PEBP family protein [Parcubacteria group bacterium Gr01-1014_20]|nr:MAG: PEBP family protein [Parcubacteria group bacterium Gr01-1014_20]
MLLTSPSFNHNEKIPQKFTCDGGNVNPELIIQNVPAKTVSLALIVDDPDAPAGNFTHWLAWNIGPKTQTIKQESRPPFAIEGLNGRQKIGYTGPCPPDGKPHRYFFKLYALSDNLKIPPSSSKEELELALEPYLIEKTELIGIYER